MLKYILRDVGGNATAFSSPLKVSLVSSQDAPADSLTAVFAVSGRIPALRSAEVLRDGERVFFGYIDEQSEELNDNGRFLTVSARSLAAVLLDNEACPQIYCSPSMPLLMKRHFAPLGFKDYIGADKAFNGQLVITKGMSEWAVLRSFCEYFTGTAPRIKADGVIDISGEENSGTVYLSPDKTFMIKRELKNKALVSRIWARTRAAGDYSLPVDSKRAAQAGVTRIRYFNAADSRSGTVLTAEKMIKKADKSCERLTVGYAGCMLCETGARLIMSGDRRIYGITGIVYILDSSGERTTIYAEVNGE